MTSASNRSWSLPDAVVMIVDECDIPEGVTLPAYRASRPMRYSLKYRILSTILHR